MNEWSWFKSRVATEATKARTLFRQDGEPIQEGPNSTWAHWDPLVGDHSDFMTKSIFTILMRIQRIYTGVRKSDPRWTSTWPYCRPCPLGYLNPSSVSSIYFLTGNTFTLRLTSRIASRAPSHVLLLPVSKNLNACDVSTPEFIILDIFGSFHQNFQPFQPHPMFSVPVPAAEWRNFWNSHWSTLLTSIFSSTLQNFATQAWCKSISASIFSAEGNSVTPLHILETAIDITSVKPMPFDFPKAL